MSGRSTSRQAALFSLITRAQTLAEAALLYADIGWHIFPLRMQSKRPYGDTRGFYEATTNSKVISRWWDRHPDSNIGFLPGRSGIVVYDIDSQASQTFAERLGLLARPTLMVKTGRLEFAAACHLYFEHPGSGLRIGNIRLGGVLEVKADSGYVVLPPSLHPSGASYAFTRCLEPLHLPSLARAALLAPPSAARSYQPRDIPRLPSIPESSRHNTLLTAISRLVRLTNERMKPEEVFGWAQALNEARCSPKPIPAAEVWAIIQWVYSRQQAQVSGSNSSKIRFGAPPTAGHLFQSFGNG